MIRFDFSTLLLFLAVSLLSNLVAAQPTVTANRGTPAIDGVVDAIWQTAATVDVSQVSTDGLAIAADKAATATARFLWDDSHLYFLMRVKDSVRSIQNGAPWEQDSIELFIDELQDRSTSYGKDDAHYRVNCEGNVSGGAGFQSKNFSAVAKAIDASDEDAGYVVEGSIAWQFVKPVGGKSIGLDLQVNDDDGRGSRVAIAKWASDKNNSWQSPATHGTLQLVASGDAPQPVAVANTTNSANPVTPENPETKVVDSSAENSADDKQEPPPVKVVPFKNPVPQWASGAVFYQLFPERFRNGDPSNDPTRESLEFPDVMPESWAVTPWTQQWYARSDWEKELGDDFYEDGVFHRRYGGDLAGVLSKIDYFQELGINAIYFNPVFYARSLHKYDGNSFHHVDPHFGPNPERDFRQMATETADPATWTMTSADRMFLMIVREAHRRGIRIIIDGVFNHSGRDFFAFDHIRRNGKDSPYVDWYEIESFDDPDTDENEFKYKCWWGVDTLPEFANSVDGQNLHDGPKKYIFDATRRWMDPNGDGDPSDGIDGWRLDVANEVPDAFWQDWHAHVRTINPNAYTVAEIWDDSAAYIQRCGFSATMNYHGFAFPVKGFLVDGRLPASEFAKELTSRRELHGESAQRVLQNLIDSHDTDRVASMLVNAALERPYVRGDRYDYDVGDRVSPRHWEEYNTRKPTAVHREWQKLIALFQMTYVGAPMIYYGTEAGMWGGDDPCDRAPMVWDDLNYESQTLDAEGNKHPPDKVEFDRELFEYYQSLIKLRKEHLPLQIGTFQLLHAGDETQTFAFSRWHENDQMAVAINRDDFPHTITLDPTHLDGAYAGSVIFSTLGQKGVVSPNSEGKWQLRLPPRTGLVIKLTR